MVYFVEYNGKYIASFSSRSARTAMNRALKLINSRGYKNDESNVLRIKDQLLNEYDPITGEPLNDDLTD